MLPKVPKSKDGKGSGGNGFRGLLNYVREHAFALAHRFVQSVDTAASEMRAVAGDANKPVYHFILSWAALERPTDEQMFEAGDIALAHLGLSENQAVLAIHRNRAHHHLHVEVNVVGFDGKKADLGHDFLRLEKVCREIEFKQGWAQDRGKYNPVINPDGSVSLDGLSPYAKMGYKLTDGEVGRERRTGQEPLVEYLKHDEIFEHIEAIFDMSRSWAELNDRLAQYGLRYEAKGSGAKLVSTADPKDCCSPSHVDKSWSRSKLEARLGLLVTRTPEYNTAEKANGQSVGGPQVNRPEKVADIPPKPVHLIFEADEDTERKKRYKLLLLSKIYLVRIRSTIKDDLQSIDRHHDGNIHIRLTSGTRIVDEGDRISTDNGNDDRAIQVMLEIARAKGWTSINVSGTKDFQVRAARAAVLAGFNVTNPDLADVVSVVMQEREAQLGIRDTFQIKSNVTEARQRCWARYSEAKQLCADQRFQHEAERDELIETHSAWRDIQEQGQQERALNLEMTFPEGPEAEIFRAWHKDKAKRENASQAEHQCRERKDLQKLQRVARKSVSIPDWRTWLRVETGRGDEDARVVIEAIDKRQAATAKKPAPSRVDRREADRQELEAMRRIDLIAMAQSLGYAVDKAESTQHSVKLRKDGEVLIAATAKDGTWSYFNSQVSTDNGGVIQFMQSRLGSGANLGDVRRALRPHLANVDAAAPPQAAQERKRDHTAARQGWNMAKTIVPSYLLERGITEATLTAYARDQVREDGRGNVLFAHRDQAGNVLGFEVKGPNWSGFAKGGQKTLAIFGTSDSRKSALRIVLTESGIDALSLAQMEGRADTLYVSTGGGFGKRTLEEVKALVAAHSGAEIALGFDNDYAGEEMAEKVSEAFDFETTRLRPIGKDWNEDLGWGRPRHGPGMRH
ncbi:MAG: relaxase/mobilization nuclease domain-containing protein [Alphaproteobacteria bacterium]|nr:relaxase/mobilization nuclease domain-containing protein [Alphaproteobacteria bacterium]